MDAVFLFIFRSGVWLASFTIVFFLFLRNERFFRLNRIFLLTGIAAALFLPLITIKYTVALSLPEGSVENAAIVANSAAIGSENTGGQVQAVLWIYIAGVAFVTGLFLIRSRAVFKALRKSSSTAIDNVKLVREGEYTGSFSFFSWVFVNPSASETEAREIMNHELVHINQKHWIDLILAEVICIMQWFNPFSWVYIHFIRQNHEYLADEGALQRSVDPAVYRAALLNQVIGLPVFSVSNSFNYSLTSKRFKMMKNIDTSPYRKLRILLILPVMAAILAAFARPEYRYSGVNDGSNGSRGGLFQDKTVKGIVVQQDGTPLERATIQVQGTTIGTMTDSKGVFTLSKFPDGKNLIVTYIGFSHRVVKPDYTKEMRIVMLRDTINLPAVQTPPPPPPPPPPFSLKDLSKSTLVIIDGVETKVDPAQLDPNKYASVILWQDESAKSKYGEKGKNGVLELRTKKAAGVHDDEFTYYAKARINKTIVDTVKHSNTEYIAVEKVKEEKPGDDKTFVIVEEMPSFPGGQEALYAWISSNIKYPGVAYKNGIQGQVIVIFAVMADGSIGNASIFKGVDPSLDNEALRVVNSMPRWKPGVQSGKKVNVYIKVPIDFKLK